jgi:gliding motility-associated-like protein
MKKIIALLCLICTTLLNGQGLSVDTQTYSVPQLVNDVLINSPCVNAQNITWRTGTNFGSANGIGYFANTNPAFPMQSGVILSTGNVQQAAGPNTSTQSGGNSNWTGDSSLEATLAAAGIQMNSTNATVLEFDFTPISSNFDFDFLFASEEYGNYQCQFSDAFAFLLTNTATGVTTNLAIVPGTTDPISVLTIRDFLYNSTCQSVNSQFFGSYNGGSNAASSATNFNGQTVVMSASTMLTPNVMYHIKLVIADRNDFESDSAIFISSGSFNIGQEVLGNDLTVSDSTAICEGQTTVINSQLSSATYTFQWKKDGQILAGETASTLIVSQLGNYELVYTNFILNCEPISDFILVEFYPEFITPDPRNLHKCNTGQSTYVFDLSQNTAITTAGLDPQTTVSYHATLSQAQNNSNSLPLQYTSSGNQTIYIRINNPSTGCFVVKTFLLQLVAPPTATMPANFVVCSNSSNSTVGTFSVSSLNSEILNGQNINLYTIAYYPTLADANSATNGISGNYNSTGETIYAVVSLTDDSSCNATTTVNLSVIPTPVVDQLDRVITCNSYTLQPLNNGNYFSGANGSGTPLFAGDIITESQTVYIFTQTTGTPSCPSESSFEIIIIVPQDIPDYTDDYCDQFTVPTTIFGGFYSQAGGTGNSIPFGTVLTTSQTIFFYYVSAVDPSCIIDIPSNIQIVASQTVPTFSNQFDCSGYILPNLSFGNYYTGPNGTGTILSEGTTITNSQTIYIYGQIANCSSESVFRVVIGLDFPTDVTECAQFVLPTLDVGNYYSQPMGMGAIIPAGTLITTSQTIYVYVATATQPNCTDNYSFNVTITLPEIQVPINNTACSNYILPSLSQGNYFTETNGTGTALAVGTAITSSQTIYIYLDNNAGCTAEKPFSIIVNQPPVIDSRSEIDACHSYILTNLSNGNYYTGVNGTGTLYPGGTVLTNSQLIYIYDTNNNCAAETSFQLNIFTISAQQLNNLSVCDSYILPNLLPNNKYYTVTGGRNGQGVELFPGAVISVTQTIYIFIESGQRINCTDESSFTVTVIPTPIVDTVFDVQACNSYILPVLTTGNYYTQSGGNGAMLAQGSSISTNQTVYVYAETGTNPNCFDEKSFEITIYKVDVLPDVTTCENYTLPVLSVGNYYNGSNGSGGILNSGTSITASQTVYIFGMSNFTGGCTDESQFQITIIPRPVAYAIPLANRTFCDSDTLNDGITNVNLNNFDTLILGNQTGNNFSVTYFLNNNDALSNLNPIQNTTTNVVFARVSNNLANSCYAILPISIIVNKLPEPKPKDGIVCINSVTNILLNPYIITSELSANNHSFIWTDAAGLVIGNSSSYTAMLPGSYTVIATNTSTGCVSLPVTVVVNQSEPAEVSYVVNDDFGTNQSITITANGLGGVYEYQLDNGSFQDSPIFYNVISGMHTITVNDKNGCEPTIIEIIVLNYPPFFTPNGDGANDTWNIKDLFNQKDALIEIYDRYGKVLKQIRPSSSGWNGMYNNNMMPADDYWFTVHYSYNNEQREFKSHFALKR